jgi:hypothetical protein
MGYVGAAVVSFFREIIVSSSRPLIPTDTFQGKRRNIQFNQEVKPT